MDFAFYRPIDPKAVGVLIKIPNCIHMYADFNRIEIAAESRHMRVTEYKQKNKLGGGCRWVGFLAEHVSYPSFSYADHISTAFVHAYSSGTEFVEVTEIPDWAKFDKAAASAAYDKAKAEEDANIDARIKEKLKANEAGRVKRLADETAARAKSNFIVRLWRRFMCE